AEIPFSLIATHVRRREQVEAKGNQVHVERKIVRWIPEVPETDDKGRPTTPGYTVLEPKARPDWRAEEALSEVASGERVVVRLAVTVDEEIAYVIAEDRLPAGLEPEQKGAAGPFARFEPRDDRVAFFATRLSKGVHVFSYVARAVRPGTYRALSAEAYPMYEPEIHGRSSSYGIAVKVEGVKARVKTPDEVYAEVLTAALEKRHEDALAGIATLLGQRVRKEIKHELLALRLDAQLALDRRGPAVKTFEALLDQNPRLARSRSDVPETGMELAVAFAEVSDHARARELLARLIGRQFGIDQAVAEVYRALRQPLAAQDYVFDLLRRYPDEDYVISGFYQTARRYYDLDAKARGAGPKSKKMYFEAFEALTTFCAFYPESKLADDAQLLAGKSLYDLGQAAAAAIELAKVPARYPRSELVDDALYLRTVALYKEADYEGALKTGDRVLAYREPIPKSKRTRKSPFNPKVEHLFAKIHHLRGDLEQAVKYYERVKNQENDAAAALAFLTERKVEVPPAVMQAPGQVKLPVRFKNLKELKARIYPVDLLLLFAKEKDLSKIAKVDLTGIAPKATDTIQLGGERFTWNEREVKLSIREPGAYLVVAKADDLDASTLVILSDLKVQVQATQGVTRVYATARSTGKPLANAYVTVSDGYRILGRGRTDARGVFQVSGTAQNLSVVAEHEGAYALYRRGLLE
ncbi:MAG: alpha-2-macroglobulin family protein, partial [Planctomycetota bacterium]